MGNKWEKIGFVVLLMVILLVGWLGWYLFVYANHWRILAFVALATLIFTIVTYRIDKKREDREWILRNREAFLIEIMVMIFSTMRGGSVVDIIKQVKLIQPALIAHGSKDMLEAWDNIQNTLEETDSSKRMVEYERFLRAIRKELGRDDSEIPPGHILKVIIHADERGALLKDFEGVKYD